MHPNQIRKISVNLRKKSTPIILLLAVFLLGAVLRLYKHHDYLVFQLDQSRDALVVSSAVEGISKLPLLGPQSSGFTFESNEKLRLGPIFYYFQYLPALLFGDNPQALAFPDLFFSIFSIFLFYIFIRKYFHESISLVLTSIFSVSYFLIFYGRFAWNPNSIPFFFLLMGIALLNSSNENKSERHRLLWFSLAVFSVSVLTQLHFITFFLAPAVFVLYMLFNRKLINLKLILILIGIFTFIYVPIIISEYETAGKNTHLLIKAITSKVEPSSGKNEILGNIFEDYQKISFYSWTTVSSDQKLETLELYKKKSGKLSIKCDKDCRQNIFHLAIASLFTALGFYLLLRRHQGEASLEKKNFLLWNIVVYVCAFVILVPVIQKDYPRFYLVITIPAFVLLGLIFNFIKSKILFPANYLSIGIIAAFLLLSNSMSVFHYYAEAETGFSHSDIEIANQDIISPGGRKVALWQLESISRYILQDSRENHINPLVITADNYYARSIYYILSREHKAPISCYYKQSDFDPPFLADKAYLIISSDPEDAPEDDIKDAYNIDSGRNFGSLRVYRLEAKASNLGKKQDSKCRTF